MNMSPDKQIIARSLEAFDKISKIFASVFEGNDDITEKEIFTLEAISRQEKPTMSSLAELLGIGMSTATGIVDRLIEKKLSKRERNGGDRRVVRIALTEKGREAAINYQKQKKKAFGRILDMLTESEQENFVCILEKIVDRAKE